MLLLLTRNKRKIIVVIVRSILKSLLCLKLLGPTSKPNILIKICLINEKETSISNSPNLELPNILISSILASRALVRF